MDTDVEMVDPVLEQAASFQKRGSSVSSMSHSTSGAGDEDDQDVIITGSVQPTVAKSRTGSISSNKSTKSKQSEVEEVKQP